MAEIPPMRLTISTGEFIAEVEKAIVECHPSAVSATGIEAIVCRDIAKRQRKGVAKYGTTVDANPLPLRDWLRHAYEECLDQAVYLRRAMDEIDRQKSG